MEFADSDSGRVHATPGARAKCPICGCVLLAKCGEINTWHWAHESLSDCDDWFEPETPWHREWKSFFEESEREVTIGTHRADVKKNGMVFEFQNSVIDPGQVVKREDFYGRMVWVVNAVEFRENFIIRQKGDYLTFRWKSPRKTWWWAEKPLFFDLGHGWMFRVCKIYRKVPCGGWGRLLRKMEFIDWALHGDEAFDATELCLCRGGDYLSPGNRYCPLCLGEGLLHRYGRSGFLR